MKNTYSSAEKIEFYKKKIESLTLEIEVLKLRMKFHQDLVKKKEKVG